MALHSFNTTQTVVHAERLNTLSEEILLSLLCKQITAGNIPNSISHLQTLVSIMGFYYNIILCFCGSEL